MSRLTTVASTGRRMKRSVKAFIAAVRHGRGVSAGGGSAGVSSIDDRRIGLQLDLAGGHHALARLHALLDRDALAARRADAHEAALDDEAARGRRCRLAPPCSRACGAGALTTKTLSP